MNPRILYYTFDSPVPYKNLIFYPVTMKDYFLFSYCSDCLMLETDEKPSKEKLEKMNISLVEYMRKTITMNYLDFLYFSKNEENDLVSKLHLLLSISLKRELNSERDVVYKIENDKAIIIIDGEKYDGQDFDEIRNIISEMNFLDVPNMNTQKEIRDSIKIYNKIQSGNSKPASIEDLMIAVSISTGFKMEDVYELSIRKFRKMLERLDAKLSYTMLTQASLSGMVEFKKKDFVKHWLGNLDKNELDDVLVSLDSVKEKISPGGFKK